MNFVMNKTTWALWTLITFFCLILSITSRPDAPIDTSYLQQTPSTMQVQGS